MFEAIMNPVTFSFLTGSFLLLAATPPGQTRGTGKYLQFILRLRLFLRLLCNLYYVFSCFKRNENVGLIKVLRQTRARVLN